MDEMKNIVVNGIFEMDAAGFDGLRQPLLTMQQASRDEAGCHDYTFSVELDQPHHVRITERWEDMPSLLAHFASDHMTTFRQAMAANSPKQANATFFEVVEIPRPS
jgi:quinol monooxygenase YgiN